MLSQARALRGLPEGSRIGLTNLEADAYLVWRFLNPDSRYVFVNLEGIDGPVGVDRDSLDAIICIYKYPGESVAN